MSVAAAKRYAEALFELAGEKGVLEPVSEGLLKVREALKGDAQGAKTFFAARVPAAEKRRLADEKFLVGVHDYVANTVRLLVDRRREGGLMTLILHFFELREQAEGILHADVEVAREMDEEARRALTDKLSQVTGKKVVANVQVNPDLIGGMRVCIGSTLIDGSLKKSLDALGARLKAAV